MAIDPHQEALHFIRLANTKTAEMQRDLQSYFTVRIGPEQIAQTRGAPADSIPLDPHKAGQAKLASGLLAALGKSIEIQLELASALTCLQGRLAPEQAHGHEHA